MKYILKTAYHQNDRTEEPNKQLAKELADTNNKEGIKEIAGYLFDNNKSIARDCIKVLYEISFIKPELISSYTTDFLKLLKSKNNRMVWGSMIAISFIAELQAQLLFENIDLILDTIANGSVITKDAGIDALAGIAASNPEYKTKLLPIMFDYLENCRPKEMATRAAAIAHIVTSEEEKEAAKAILQSRWPELNANQLVRVKRIYNKL